MANESWNIVAEEKDISLDSITKNPDSLSWQPNDVLWWLLDDAIAWGNTDAMEVISSALKNTKEDVDVDPEVSKKLAEDKLKQDEADAEANKTRIENREQNKTSQNNEAEELKKQLEEVKKTLEEVTNKNASDLKNINNERNSLLEEILELKKSGNTEKLKEKQLENDKLTKQVVDMKDKFVWKLPDYGPDDIKKLKTRWIWFSLISKKKIDGQTVISGPQLKFRNNIRSRRRLNKTIKMFNKIWNDPKRAVRYIMSKTALTKWWKIWMWIKRIKNQLTIKDTDKFDEVFNEQKKNFIDDLSAKMWDNISTDDKATIKVISDRVDYHQKAYKRKFITA